MRDLDKMASDYVKSLGLCVEDIKVWPSIRIAFKAGFSTYQSLLSETEYSMNALKKALLDVGLARYRFGDEANGVEYYQDGEWVPSSCSKLLARFEKHLKQIE